MTDTPPPEMPPPPPPEVPSDSDSVSSKDAAQADDKIVLCPYCGAAQHGGDRCHACGGLFEPLSRKATQIAMGPWQIRDRANPFRPGCSYDVLRAMIAAGKIKPNTVMRGPTTHQFWSIARNVPGVAHLLGYCHACGDHVKPTDAVCTYCGEKFRAVISRNDLGLRFATPAEADKAQRELDAQIAQLAAEARRKKASRNAKASRRPAADTTELKPEPVTHQAVTAVASSSGDLLEDVLGIKPGDSGVLDDGRTARSDARALDFAPSGNDADAGATTLESHSPEAMIIAPAARTSAAVWIMLVLNLLALAGVAFLVYLWLNAD